MELDDIKTINDNRLLGIGYNAYLLGRDGKPKPMMTSNELVNNEINRMYKIGRQTQVIIHSR